jgi:hypothetical protein
MKTLISKLLNLKIEQGQPLRIEHNGQEVYYESNTGYFVRKEWISGELVYKENINGVRIDRRPVKLTLEQVERRLGFKLEIVE